MMRHDYIDSLLAKKSIEQWCNLTRTEVINHTLRGTKLYRDYQRAIKHDNSVVGMMLTLMLAPCSTEQPDETSLSTQTKKINSTMRLYEVIQLNEYNQQATLNKWGERIAQAAKFNKQHTNDTTLAGMWKLMDKGREQDLAVIILKQLEAIDPTANKQYVMTLIRWYTAVVKVHVQNQKLYAKLRKAELEGGAADDWEEGYNEIWPEDYTDLGKGNDNQSADYVTDRATEDWNIDDAEFDLDKIGTQSSFKLEDADQIRDALERFESIKPQLPPNERDIGRYKNFYRFEDFIDDAYDENYVPPETDNETLKRRDVEVLYNGPLGTVTIPKSHEASCALGSGTKWCTTGKDSYFYDSYSSQGDLIIYNEKPGNAKYQIHVTREWVRSQRCS